MVCIVSFIVFAILGIFSARYRALAKDAFQCVARRVTLRPCDTSLETKIRASLVSTIMKRSLPLAKFVNRYFEVLSWAFVILSVASTVLVFRGLYLYYRYGSCNGLNNSSFCVLDPSNANNQFTVIGAPVCNGSTTSSHLANLTLDPLKDATIASTLVSIGSGKQKMIVIGSITCDYTRKLYPTIKQYRNRPDVTYTFIPYPVDATAQKIQPALFCASQINPAKFNDLLDALFATSKSDLASAATVQKIFADNGYSETAISNCLANQSEMNLMSTQLSAIARTRLYGTPTVFVNGEAFVGPKPQRVYDAALKPFIFF